MPPKRKFRNIKPSDDVKNLPKMIEEPTKHKETKRMVGDVDTIPGTNNNNVSKRQKVVDQSNVNITKKRPHNVQEMLKLQEEHVVSGDVESFGSLEELFETGTPNNSHSIKIKKVKSKKTTGKSNNFR